MGTIAAQPTSSGVACRLPSIGHSQCWFTKPRRLSPESQVSVTSSPAVHNTRVPGQEWKSSAAALAFVRSCQNHPCTRHVSGIYSTYTMEKNARCHPVSQLICANKHRTNSSFAISRLPCSSKALACGYAMQVYRRALAWV
ncbi:hypothetical protein LX32DRAFT_81218 [Colletotrichum zoysiae]|uniref:Uncharacterized protein n=1 Tax=Colletotrichum zoysiae TaxID=1216348 RepID=A0AAD9LWJ1_9PEZI|nr:hypothetical protein LX32DRAFT_81218 [Colletotrichum zoysiae]